MLRAVFSMSTFQPPATTAKPWPNRHRCDAGSPQQPPLRGHRALRQMVQQRLRDPSSLSGRGRSGQADSGEDVLGGGRFWSLPAPSVHARRLAPDGLSANSSGDA